MFVKSGPFAGGQFIWLKRLVGVRGGLRLKTPAYKPEGTREMKELIIIAILLLPAAAFADQKYNPFSGKYETTSPDADLKYNPFSNKWSYEQKGSTFEYNPFEKKYEYAPPPEHKEPGRDPYGYDYYKRH